MNGRNLWPKRDSGMEVPGRGRRVGPKGWGVTWYAWEGRGQPCSRVIEYKQGKVGQENWGGNTLSGHREIF